MVHDKIHSSGGILQLVKMKNFMVRILTKRLKRLSPMFSGITHSSDIKLDKVQMLNFMLQMITTMIWIINSNVSMTNSMFLMKYFIFQGMNCDKIRSSDNIYNIFGGSYQRYVLNKMLTELVQKYFIPLTRSLSSEEMCIFCSGAEIFSLDIQQAINLMKIITQKQGPIGSTRRLLNINIQKRKTYIILIILLEPTAHISICLEIHGKKQCDQGCTISIIFS